MGMVLLYPAHTLPIAILIPASPQVHNLALAVRTLLAKEVATMLEVATDRNMNM
jgi:hypothetical protein